MELIAHGAEAKIFREKNLVIKQRIQKFYRIKQIDEKIRKYRTRREIKILEKAYNIIPVPKLYKNSSEKDYKIILEYIQGKKLADFLDSFSNKKRLEICKKIGEQIGLLHNADIVHGDLTTSNMILKDKLYFIDFGLSFIDPKSEHKAVDLHLLKQALESKHYQHFESSFKEVIKGYKCLCKNFKPILDRLAKVESRGRYKTKKYQNKKL